MRVRRSVVLGGLGDDAHSVGLVILRHALAEQGYRVEFLGTQNRLREFFERERWADVVMLSCMDGHARHYLKGFAELRREFPGAGALWYIGGNLSVNDADRLLVELVPLGFTRAFPGYVDMPSVLEVLERDLAGRPARWLGREQEAPAAPRKVATPPDERLPASEFRAARDGVLQSWHTGPGAADLEDNATFLARCPSFAGAHKGPGTLVQPRSGVALAGDQLAAFRALRRAGADVLSFQVDSLTRGNAYQAAEEAIAESRERRESTLNGFPMVNHGVAAVRRIMAGIRVPLQTRHSTRDPRLLAEISYAGGVSGYEGGAISYNLPYFKSYPLASSLARWQYVDRLTGIYADEFGIVIDREFFGTLTAVLIPPCLAIVVNLIEAILAVRQGVRSVSLGYAEQGNRVQDIAAVRVMRELGEKTLSNLGYQQVRVNTVFHQYMAAFPRDLARARALITASAKTARMSGASRVLVKTAVEATRIPAIADNAEGLALSRFGIAASATVDEAAVAAEEHIIRAETEQLLESVFMSGAGSLTQGVVAAFERGHLDIPFSPSLENRGEALTARDLTGAVRFLSTGRLPFSADIKAFHKALMAERRRAATPPFRSDWQIVEHDVLQIQDGHYERWPLS